MSDLEWFKDGIYHIQIQSICRETKEVVWKFLIWIWSIIFANFNKCPKILLGLVIFGWTVFWKLPYQFISLLHLRTKWIEQILVCQNVVFALYVSVTNRYLPLIENLGYWKVLVPKKVISDKMNVIYIFLSEIVGQFCMSDNQGGSAKCPPPPWNSVRY